MATSTEGFRFFDALSIVEASSATKHGPGSDKGESFKGDADWLAIKGNVGLLTSEEDAGRMVMAAGLSTSLSMCCTESIGEEAQRTSTDP